MPITIRHLTPDDTDAYITLRKAMLHDAPGSFGSDPSDDRGSDPVRMRQRLADYPQSVTFGAIDDAAGRLVGALGFRRETRKKQAHGAVLWGMYVDPAFRRKGIARRLVSTAIRHASGMDGLVRLALSVSTSAPGAQRLYESLGFVVWGTEPDALRIDGMSYDERHMLLTFER